MERAKPAAAAHGASASALSGAVGCATSSFELATLAPAGSSTDAQSVGAVGVGAVGGVEAPR